MAGLPKAWTQQSDALTLRYNVTGVKRATSEEDLMPLIRWVNIASTELRVCLMTMSRFGRQAKRGVSMKNTLLCTKHPWS